MQSNNEILTMEEALLEVKKRGQALNELNPELTDDVLFAWCISRILSDANDEIREKYVSKFFIQEGIKLFASLATVTISSLFITGVLLLPLPSLVVLIVGSLLASISGVYAVNKIYQHTTGFFKSKRSTEQLNKRSLYELNKQPADIIYGINKFLSPSDTGNLFSVSRETHSLFQSKRLLNIFLQRVAYGMQDKVEKLFTDVYARDAVKIQEALRYQGQFTDYSGRRFNCTAYEYAYWAKDTHMCRMLERYMDAKTKAFMAASIDEIERIDAATGRPVGLVYQQAGQEHRSAHFDFTPLKEAYQLYIDGRAAWVGAHDWAAIDKAWLGVGKAQRNVPAHVAQEYCRPDRAFNPCPEFNEATLPRVLTLYNSVRYRNDSWFPQAASHSGLGFDFALLRSGEDEARYCLALASLGTKNGFEFWDMPRVDLVAITRLDKVRTAQLTQSRVHLKTIRGIV